MLLKSFPTGPLSHCPCQRGEPWCCWPSFLQPSALNILGREALCSLQHLFPWHTWQYPQDFSLRLPISRSSTQRLSSFCGHYFLLYHNLLDILLQPCISNGFHNICFPL